MDGFELVSRVRADHPGLPVVLMTAARFGRDRPGAPLRDGAAGYVAKRHLARDLLRTLENVLAVLRARRRSRRCWNALPRPARATCWPMTTDLVSPLVNRLQRQLEHKGLFDENVLFRVSLALREALVNAIEHGNLELSSELRKSTMTTAMCARCTDGGKSILIAAAKSCSRPARHRRCDVCDSRRRAPGLTRPPCPIRPIRIISRNRAGVG